SVSSAAGVLWWDHSWYAITSASLSGAPGSGKISSPSSYVGAGSRWSPSPSGIVIDLAVRLDLGADWLVMRIARSQRRAVCPQRVAEVVFERTDRVVAFVAADGSGPQPPAERLRN